MEKGIQMLSNDLNLITAEINSYKQVAGQAIFEIGRRLKHVKENDLVHGEWEKWCKEKIGLTRQQADKFIYVFKEFGSIDNSNCQIGITKLYEIALLPKLEREKPHQIPSTGETKTVDEMTVRELREVKKALKESKDELKRVEKENSRLANDLQKEKDKIKQVEVKTVEKVIDNTDYKQIDALKKELEYQNKKYENISKQKLILEQQLERSDVKVKEYEELTNKLKAVTREQDDLGRQVEATSELSEMVWEIEKVLKGSLAPVKYAKAIRDMSDNQIIMNNLDSVIGHVESWCKEMRKITNKNNIIEVF
ncbi:DUF3102 domain-containing protein [Bacillus subtilis]|uniref:DUF3102 domain-containing protein n=1 Tax=Bacillus subtilis TaxID=1423 RepID=UPI0009331BB4|nr:DUF3102 domain-containing protein [Bacillus subtilis]MDR4182248.1 DUF3102 domain-containing protein [Bacillus subtilis]URM16728.1 DUF3102 domain-containing protein [Bacillus subtilis]